MAHLHTATTSNKRDLAVHSDAHRLRRTFIGPLPKRTATQPKGKGNTRAKLDNAELEDSDGLRDAIRTLALDFFLRHGGVPEQWGEERAQSVRDEMHRRWRQSEWGRSLRQRKDARADRNWVGTSFEVGVFLGVDTLDKTSHIEASSSTYTAPGTPSKHAATSTDFVTAPSQFSAAQDREDRASYDAPALSESKKNGSISVRTTLLNVDETTADSSTALITPDPGRATDAHDAMNSPSTHRDVPLDKVVHKGKLHVHYADADPAPPSEVLTRTGEAVENTSAGAIHQDGPATQVAWGNVVMRGTVFTFLYLTPDLIMKNRQDARKVLSLAC